MQRHGLSRTASRLCHHSVVYFVCGLFSYNYQRSLENKGSTLTPNTVLSYFLDYLSLGCNHPFQLCTCDFTVLFIRYSSQDCFDWKRVHKTRYPGIIQTVVPQVLLNHLAVFSVPESLSYSMQILWYSKIAFRLVINFIIYIQVLVMHIDM